MVTHRDSHWCVSLPPLFNPVKWERKGSCHNHHLHIIEWKVEACRSLISWRSDLFAIHGVLLNTNTKGTTLTVHLCGLYMWKWVYDNPSTSAFCLDSASVLLLVTLSHFCFAYSKRLVTAKQDGRKSLTTIWEIVIFKVNYSGIHRWLPTTGNSLESFMRKTTRLCTDYFLVWKLRGGTTCIL